MVVDLSGTTILLTGGTGSFGNAFVENVTKRWPDVVIRVYSRDELKQVEMRAKLGDEQLRFFIGDVRDRNRLTRAAEGADFIVHAAAMKQVPICEYNPSEAIQTNVVGAQNVVDAAIDAQVKKVVALSTDKAVNPVNLYGATKLCAEKVIVQGNAYAARGHTRFSCVRYGNVVGSRGSVVPLFTQQAKDGKITITDESMTRFWITLPQSVDLVIYALERMSGGEIFVPKIPSMNIVDLARAIAPECRLDVVGVRPGEKLHETMVPEDDARNTVEYDDCFVIRSAAVSGYANGNGGRPCPEGFRYSSDNNPRWLSVDELQRLIEGHE